MDAIWLEDPCAGCGAEIGEPCRPTCIGLAQAQDDGLVACDTCAAQSVKLPAVWPPRRDWWLCESCYEAEKGGE